MQREQVKVGALVIAAMLVAYLCYLMLEPFLMPIIWAGILAILITPLHKRLQEHVKSPGLSSLIACLIALFVVVVPIGIVVTLVAQTIVDLLNNTVLADSTDPEAISRWAMDRVHQITTWLSANVGIRDLNVSMDDIKDAVSKLAAFFASQSKGIVGGVAGFLFNLILVLLTLFFFLRDRDAILNALRSLLPLSHKNASAVFKRVEDVIRASVVGGGAVALAQGALALIGYWVLGIPSPFLWGCVTMFSSFIPFVGAAGVWVPAAIYLFIKGSTVKGFILVGWGALGISMVDNIIRPIVVGDRTSLPTVLLLFSILGGLKVFGFLGIIMGPVVLVVAIATLEVFRFEMAESEEERRQVAAAIEGSSAGPTEAPLAP